MPALPPIAPRLDAHTCKVCGSPAPWLGAVDFARWCSRDWHKIPTIGVAVDYYRCASCGLLFSPSFDAFTPEQWKIFVYNPEYLQIDPDYAGARGQGYANMFARAFPAAAPLHVVDYGCGRGTLGETLRDLNWRDVTTYDPFVPEFAHRPESKADLLIALEVLEHSPDPAGTFQDMASLRRDDGLIVATTLFVPSDLNAPVLNWWYVAPRNGHVTIHSEKSLRLLASRANLKMLSNPTTSVHYFWREKPLWAAHVLPS
jgi:2-polyprenyl-6-hydroxyphenyl methylase/3-demethylubiquinone-9 3-methyltransferase